MERDFAFVSTGNESLWIHCWLRKIRFDWLWIHSGLRKIRFDRGKPTKKTDDPDNPTFQSTFVTVSSEF